MVGSLLHTLRDSLCIWMHRRAGKAHLSLCSKLTLAVSHTKVAFGIEDTSSTGDGRIVAVVGSQKLVVGTRDNFENIVQEWTHQFAEQSDSNVWKKAVEAMQQLNPCTVVDLFGDGDSSDFARISIISRLIVEVSDVLSTGSKEERAEALRTLAIDAPQVFERILGAKAPLRRSLCSLEGPGCSNDPVGGTVHGENLLCAFRGLFRSLPDALGY